MAFTLVARCANYHMADAVAAVQMNAANVPITTAELDSFFLQGPPVSDTTIVLSPGLIERTIVANGTAMMAQVYPVVADQINSLRDFLPGILRQRVPAHVTFSSVT